MDEQNMNLLYGWVCPVCGAVMAPHERACINCRGYGEGIGVTGMPSSAPFMEDVNAWQPECCEPMNTPAISSKGK